MLSQMTAREFREWLVFNSLEPFLEERVGDLFASVVQLLMNVHRDRRKRRSPFDLKAARLYFGDENAKGKTDWKLVAEQMRTMATVMKLKNQQSPRKRKTDV